MNPTPQLWSGRSPETSGSHCHFFLFMLYFDIHPLIPFWNIFHSFPQSPLQDRIPNGKPANLPHSEGIELGSLFLDNIEAIPHSFPKKHKRFHLVSNPSTIQINEIVIGITSMDVLFHIGCEETNSKLMGNRLSRLAQHILQQRSFYPLFPPPMGAASLDLNFGIEWK